METAADSAQTPSAEIRPCPNCSNPIPFYREYVPWCEKCGWGLAWEARGEKPNLYKRIYAQLGEQNGRRLFDELMASDMLYPRFGAARVAGLILALLVYAIAVLAFALGVVLLIAGLKNLFALLGAAICFSLTWLALPRPGKLGRDEQLATRSEFPALYAVADRLSAALGAPPLDGIVITWWFNAAYGRVGWRQKRVMWLGLPLLTVLDDRGMVAIMGHELAHAVNRDPTRGFVISSAIATLANWWYVVVPGELWPRGAGLHGLIYVPVNLLMAGIAGVLWLWINALVHLMWHDSQQSEYLADVLGAKASGSEPAVASQERSHLRGAYVGTARHIALQQRDTENYFDALRREVSRIPEREHERVRRVIQLEKTRLDDTHPPSAWRMAVLRKHPVPAGAVAITTEESQAIAAELKTQERRVQRLLLDAVRSSI